MDFVGRRRHLRTLATAASGPGARAHAITGPGGIGKTRLAVEHAYAHRPDLDVVWWVRAEEPTTLRTDLARLGSHLGLRSVSAASLDATGREVRAWLADHDRWLLVADNAEDADDVAAVLPSRGGGQVLVTSRNDGWAEITQVVDVDVLDDAAAAGYLLRRTGQTDGAAALSLARALGCLPLALDKAATHISQCPGLRLGDYLDEFRTRAARPDDRPPRPYSRAVAVACTLAVERVEELSPPATTLLRACAFLAPEAVPLSMLSGADELPEPLAVGPLAQRDALATLTRLGLIRSTWAGGLAVDRVIQAVVRDDLADERRRTWAAGVVRLVEGAFPVDSHDLTTWDQCGRLVSHALASTAHDEGVELEPQATSRLLSRVGIYLQSRGQYDEARRLLERSLTITEVTYGPDCSEAGVHLANLAEVLQDVGDLSGARRCLERAVAVAEVNHGDDHPIVAGYCGNLGSVLADQGETARARRCFERALAIDEATHGPDHPSVANDLSSLGIVSWAEGDLVDACRCFGEALAIDEGLYGTQDPSVAGDLANLALVLAEAGELAEARSRLERALAIAEAVFGPAHPEVAPHLNNLAMVLQDCGQFTAARACLERALAIAEESHGDAHPAVAGVLNNLGSVLSHLGETCDAIHCLDRALAIDEAALGPDDPEVHAIRANRARLTNE